MITLTDTQRLLLAWAAPTRPIDTTAIRRSLLAISGEVGDTLRRLVYPLTADQIAALLDGDKACRPKSVEPIQSIREV